MRSRYSLKDIDADQKVTLPYTNSTSFIIWQDDMMLNSAACGVWHHPHLPREGDTISFVKGETHVFGKVTKVHFEILNNGTYCNITAIQV